MKNTVYKTDIGLAIKDINPNAQFSIRNDDYEEINWVDDTPVIPTAEIKARQKIMDVRDRHIMPRLLAFNYEMKIEQQLDNLYHDIDNGKFGDDPKNGLFFTGIQAIKDKYPKE